MSGSLLKRVAVDRRPLAYPDFRRLWLGQGVSFVGYQVTTVAVPLQIYAITKSSLWVGFIGFASLVPLVVFGLWGGAIADVMERRKLVLIASMVTWAATWGLLLQAIVHANSAILLLCLIAVQSAGFAVSGPTRGAIIPRLVPLELVAPANAVNFVVQNVGTIAGPLLGAVVVDKVGYFGAYGLDLALFTASLYASYRLPRIPPIPQAVGAPQLTEAAGADLAGAEVGRAELAGGVPVGTGSSTQPRPRSRAGFRSVAEGVAFISRRPVLWMSFVVDLIAMSFAMPRALFPAVAHERFGGAAAVGWLYAAIAIGAVVGGLSSGWLGHVRRQGVTMVVGIVGWGVFVALAGLSHLLWLTVVLLALAGAGDLVSTVCRQTIVQTSVPDELRGRLQGVYTVVVVGGPRLGDVRAGAVAAVAGTSVAWVSGGVACVVGLLVVVVLVPSFVGYVRPPLDQGALDQAAPDQAAPGAPD
ncbi:MAG: MFS transporter [Acidothermaceae bacterium]